MSLKSLTECDSSLIEYEIKPDDEGTRAICNLSRSLQDLRDIYFFDIKIKYYNDKLLLIRVLFTRT